MSALFWPTCLLSSGILLLFQRKNFTLLANIPHEAKEGLHLNKPDK